MASQDDQSWKSSGGRQQSQQWRAGAAGSGGTGGGLPLRIQRMALGFVTLCLAVLIGWLIVKLAFDTVPQAHVVTMGISVYRDHPAIPLNPFGREDSKAFEVLRTVNPDQFARVVPLENVLETHEVLMGQLPREVGTVAGLTGKNLIVFCSVHGIVLAGEDRPAAHLMAMGYTPDSRHDPGARARDTVSANDFLRLLAKSPAERVVLLVETGRLGPNWRLGVLTDDFADQFLAEAEEICRTNPKLQVICSTRFHEHSWTSKEWGPGQSVFAHYVLEGLKGEADGSASAEGGQDNRVSSNELYAYVSDRVAAWARERRGVEQTVTRVSSDDTDFALVQVREPSSEPAAEETESEEAAAEEDSAEDKSEAEAGDEADGTEDGQDKDASSTKKKKEPPAEESEPADAADSAEGASDQESDRKKGDGQAGDAKTGKDGADSESKDGDAGGKSERDIQLERLRQQLAEYWEERDKLSKGGIAAVAAPGDWRILQSRLVRIERLLRYEAIASEQSSPDEVIDSTLDRIQAQTGEDPAEGELKELRTLSQGAATLAGRQGGGPGEAEKEFRKLVQAALQAKPDDPKPSADLVDFLQQNPAGEFALIALLLEQAEGLESGARDELVNLQKLLGLVRRQVAAERRPAELAAIESMTRLAEASLADERPWPADFGQACRDSLRWRLRVEREAFPEPEQFPFVRGSLQATLNAVTAAERWLQVGNAPRAQQWLASTRELSEGMQDTGQLASDALRLRAALLAQLPDFTCWVADRGPTDEVAVTERMRRLAQHFRKTATWDNNEQLSEVRHLFGEGSAERQMLELVVQARGGEVLLENVITGNTLDARAKTELSGWVKTTRDLLSSFLDRSFRDTIDGLSGKTEELSPEDWQRIDQLLRVPWIGRPDRVRLLGQLELLDDSASRGTSSDLKMGESRKAAQDPCSSEGFWQGFWAIQTLTLAGGDAFELWKAWDEYVAVCESETRPSGAELARQTRFQSARLGGSISEAWRQLWNQLTERDSARPSPALSKDAVGLTETVRLWRQERLLWAVDPMDFGPTGASEFLQGIRDHRLQNVLCFRNQQWRLRARSYDADPQDRAYQSLADRCTRLLARIDPAFICRDQGTRPLLELAGLPESVNLSPQDGRRVTLDVVVKRTDSTSDSQTPLAAKLRLEGPHLQIRCDGVDVADGETISVGSEPETRHYAVELSASAGSASQTLTVALLQGAGDELPIELRQMRLNPPLATRQWQIAFVTRQEAATEVSLAGQVRNFFDDNGAELRLPTTGNPKAKPFELESYLIRPKNDATRFVDVEVFAADRKDAATPLLPALRNVQLAPPGEPTFLHFNLGGTADAKKPEGGTTPPAPPTPSEIDVSGGLEFRLTPKDKPSFTRRVTPRLWSSDKFVEITHTEFIGGRLSLRLQRAAQEDPLLPEAIPVTLRLPPTLKRLYVNARLEEPALEVGKPRELFAEFREVDLTGLEDEQFEMTLHLAGMPHARRWQLSCDAGRWRVDAVPKKGLTTARQDPLVRVINPANGTILKQADALDVRIEVDLPRRDRRDDSSAWTLDYVLIQSGSPRTLLPEHSWRVPRSLQESIKVHAVKEGVWQFTAAADDYRSSLSTDNRGRFRLQARLRSPDGTRAVNHEVLFAIDSPDSPPPPPEVRAPSTLLLNNRPLQFDVSVQDPQSGISEIAFGFDQDDDEKLGDAEIRGTVKFEQPLLRSRDSVSMQIAADKLPEEDGTYRLLVQAKNGLGQPCEDAATCLVEMKRPIEYGTLFLTLNNLAPGRSGKVRVIDMTTQKVHSLEFGFRGPANPTFRLPKGQYEVEITARGKTVRSTPVTIVTGEKSQSVTFNLATLVFE